MWYIYLLKSDKRSYIGSTTDPTRRLRQHNGEIKGGARSTRGRKWEIVSYVSGFENRSSACRWERIVKCRCRGLADRNRAMYLLSILRDTSVMTVAKKRVYDIPEGLQYIKPGEGELDA
jgi:structure-specific endonuclease subunit SLX1